MGFIEELYFGNIKPSEKSFNRNTQYEKAIKIFCENEKKLSEALSGEELRLFCDLVSASDEINAVSSLEDFKLGFRLGVLLMCDSLLPEDNKIFKGITE